MYSRSGGNDRCRCFFSFYHCLGYPLAHRYTTLEIDKRLQRGDIDNDEDNHTRGTHGESTAICVNISIDTFLSLYIHTILLDIVYTICAAYPDRPACIRRKGTASKRIGETEGQ